MAKVYSNKWPTKMLEINFNQKQWRQDFGAFVRSKLFWDGRTMVTKSRAIDSKNLVSKGIKYFEVYNCYGASIEVQYQNCNEIVHTNNPELLDEYLKMRGAK